MLQTKVPLEQTPEVETALKAQVALVIATFVLAQTVSCANVIAGVGVSET